MGRLGAGFAWCCFSLAWTTSGVAASSDDGAFCVGACRSSLATVNFTDFDDGTSFAAQECTSILHLKSVYLCTGLHCTQEARHDGLGELNQTCREAVGTSVPPYDLVSDFSDEDISRLFRFNATHVESYTPFDAPVLPNEEYFDLWGRTLSTWNYVKSYHHAYAWLMGYYWVAVIAIGVLNRALMLFEARVRGSFERQSTGMVWVKRKLITPATFGQRCVQDYGGWCTVPPRVQSLSVVVFVLINVFCSIHGYRFFPGMLYFPDETKQVLRYASDRTGIISMANFPLIWLFGMRNNVVIWLTGWDFGTYNNFHRWIARIATIQAVVHSVGYTIIIFREGGWEYFGWWMSRMFFWVGELATIFMVAIVVFSVYWIRRQQYELFLLAHIGLSMLLLLTMLGHVSIFHGEWDALVWYPVLIWVLDRVLRGLRILAFNLKFWNTYGKITYHDSADMIRLTIPLQSSWQSVKPGTFYYIMVFGQGNFWESHPFTVASATDKGQAEVELQEEASPLLRPTSPSQMDDTKGGGSSSGHMTFLIRPYDSFTSRLRELAQLHEPKAATVRVAVDGPYGKTLPLEIFDNVIFVVGGSGIVFPLSYMRKLTSPANKPRSIHVHWTVRQAALALDVLEHDFRDMLDCERLHIHIHVTGDLHSPVADESRSRRVNWNHGRMQAEEVIGNAVLSAEAGSLAVVACGPARMADECRRVAAEYMASDKLRIEYFEESFQW